jgi:hypothetical protein
MNALNNTLKRERREREENLKGTDRRSIIISRHQIYAVAVFIHKM